ncbi:MAG: SDR family oxidoreductase [Saprospiraceae bacterium]|nr:SDR family oxidoreductase [Saprospiraceae bacterium]
MLSLKSKIFVTGATGFLGSYIVRTLAEDGYENIICLKRPESRTDILDDIADKVVWLEGDILDVPFLSEALIGVDCLIHAAAIVNFEPGNRKKMIQVASDGTANLVNMALENHILKFVHISSVAAIGRRKLKEDIDETKMFSHSKYDTTYGLSKFLAEQEVWRGHAEGLNVTILNPAMILGAGKWTTSSIQIFEKVFKGLSHYPAGTTGWVDVRDVAVAAVNCVTEKFNGERFIISAENLPYKVVLDNIADGLNVKRTDKKVQMTFAGILWRIEAIRSFITGEKPLITKETIQSTSVTSVYNHSKSVHVLGLTYRPVKDTVKEVCTLFLSTYQRGSAVLG